MSGRRIVGVALTLLGFMLFLMMVAVSPGTSPMTVGPTLPIQGLTYASGLAICVGVLMWGSAPKHSRL